MYRILFAEVSELWFWLISTLKTRLVIAFFLTVFFFPIHSSNRCIIAHCHIAESNENSLLISGDFSALKGPGRNLPCDEVKIGVRGWGRGRRVNIEVQRQARKTSPFAAHAHTHARGRLWSNSLVRAFLANLTALPTNLPASSRGNEEKMLWCIR